MPRLILKWRPLENSRFLDEEWKLRMLSTFNIDTENHWKPYSGTSGNYKTLKIFE